MEQEIYKPVENKRTKEVLIIFGFFIFMICAIVICHSMARWTYYHNNTKMSSKEVERIISFDEVDQPDPTKCYYRKVKITKTIRAKAFPKIEVIKTEKALGVFSKDK